MDKAQEHTYHSYLLRIWRTGSYGERTWRCMLEDPHTGQQHGFADLDALCAFLRQQTEAFTDAEPGTKDVRETNTKRKDSER
jgi:hypothetical protein